MMRISYVVHDLNDPAVQRRVRMLNAAGAEVALIGFRRGPVPDAVAGVPALDLGRTADARLLQRAAAVLKTLLRPGPMIDKARGSEVVIGRNLESLALAVRLRRSLPGARLVYECLDIHRTLLGGSSASRVIRAIEAHLLRGVDLLLVSSPAFLRHHFDRRRTLTAPAMLIENKLLALDGDLPKPAPPPGAPPWTIGWFGMLRCARTLATLAALAEAQEGRVRILIAGRPSPAEFPDFARQLSGLPYVSYVGPYQASDLAALYAQCHFAWAVDFFEEGLNSSWLLPNRLYEAASFGVVPIALRTVETGRWLARHQAGLLLDEPAQDLATQFAAMDEARYGSLRAAVARIPAGDLVATRQDCLALVQALAGR